MRFTITTQQLLSLTKQLAPACTRRSTDPWAEKVLLSIDGKLVAYATDGTTSVRIETEIETTEQGQYVVDHRRLYAIAESVDSESITFTSDGSQLLVKAGHRRYKLPVFPADVYPPLRERVGTDNVLSLTIRLVQMLLDRVAKYVESDSTRLLIQCIRVEVFVDHLSMTALSGLRGATTELGGDFRPLQGQLLLTPEAVKYLRLFKATKDEEVVELAWEQAHLRLSSGNSTIWCALPDGNHPMTAETFSKMRPSSLEPVATWSIVDLRSTMDALVRASGRDGFAQFDLSEQMVKVNVSDKEDSSGMGVEDSFGASLEREVHFRCLKSTLLDAASSPGDHQKAFLDDNKLWLVSAGDFDGTFMAVLALGA